VAALQQASRVPPQPTQVPPRQVVLSAQSWPTVQQASLAKPQGAGPPSRRATSASVIAASAGSTASTA
jgi:hypothetical protein